jgi:hypothetical protein
VKVLLPEGAEDLDCILMLPYYAETGVYGNYYKRSG